MTISPAEHRRVGVRIPDPAGVGDDHEVHVRGAAHGLGAALHDAGAILAPDTLKRAAKKKLAAAKLLDENDGYGFFSALGDLVVTGPTRTNVNDFRVILVTSD